MSAERLRQGKHVTVSEEVGCVTAAVVRHVRECQSDLPMTGEEAVTRMYARPALYSTRRGQTYFLHPKLGEKKLKSGKCGYERESSDKDHLEGVTRKSIL